MISTGLHAAVLLWALLSFSSFALQGDAGGIAAGRSRQREGILRAHQGRQARAQAGREAQARGREDRHSEAEAGGPEGQDRREEAGDQGHQQEAAGAARPSPSPIRSPRRSRRIRRSSRSPRTSRCRRAARRARTRSSPSSTPTRSRPCSTSAIRQRNSITGAELNSAPTLGTALGNASQLSQSELDALRARLMALWNPPVGIKNPEDFVIRIRIRLGRDGRLTRAAGVLSRGHGAMFNSARDSARARGVPRPALRHAQAGALRHLEGHRSDLRSQGHVSRLNASLNPRKPNEPNNSRSDAYFAPAARTAHRPPPPDRRRGRRRARRARRAARQCGGAPRHHARQHPADADRDHAVRRRQRGRKRKPRRA